ncbi:MAG: hypothetical protein NXI31_06045 [bacterium]|nr:hypothetical protein [bacterium]
MTAVKNEPDNQELLGADDQDGRLDLVPLEDFAGELGVRPEMLRRLWLSQVGAPQLYRLKRGFYLVSRREAVRFIESRAVPTAEQRMAVRSVIRRVALEGSRAGRAGPKRGGRR